MGNLKLFKNEIGNVVDSNGNLYTIRKSKFTSGYDALFNQNNTQLDFWHELPKHIKQLF
jgi:hypothetical protein